MKERWKIIATLLEEEFDIEVQPSYEGWGAGWDPKYLPALEMWARGEIEEIPPGVRNPKGIAFNVVEFMRRSEDYTINSIRHEISYLMNTPFPHWRIGQREVFRAGYVPASFVVLLSVLESLRADHLILEKNPSSISSLRSRLKEVLKDVRAFYPHHRAVLSICYLWLGEETPFDQEESRALRN